MGEENFICKQCFKAVEEKARYHDSNISDLWGEMKKRLPIWIFTLFATLTLALMGLQYQKSNTIEAAVNTVITNIAVIKSEIKHMNERTR